MPFSTTGFVSHEAGKKLELYQFERRDCNPDDVHVSIRWAGICHSDIHWARNEWGDGMSVFPMVPGHEIAGVVAKVGTGVTKFKVGDHVGVGCFVDSCGTCNFCANFDEDCCPKFVLTYSAKDYQGNITQGGYSRDIVVREKFVFRVPANLDLACAAPLLCAGITTYAPMKRWNADVRGKKIGVVGLGGLGHMAVKFGKAFGNEVTVISRSASKKDSAMKLGATHFLISTDPDAMKAKAGTLDFIIDTVAAQKPLDDLMALMNVGGVYCFVGIPNAAEAHAKVNQMTMIFKRLAVVGSLIGGTKITQEMLDFCGAHNVQCEVEKIKMDYVNDAWDRVVKSDVKYRFVIDVANSCPPPQ
eukprot:Polyplicarium_translucidae@DN3118_c0_g2_i10.p1